jgi:hypothetical protein
MINFIVSIVSVDFVLGMIWTLFCISTISLIMSLWIDYITLDTFDITLNKVKWINFIITFLLIIWVLSNISFLTKLKIKQLTRYENEISEMKKIEIQANPLLNAIDKAMNEKDNVKPVNRNFNKFLNPLY